MILNEFKLEGKVGVVTGAGRGLGRVLSLALAEAGADLALAARTESELTSVADEVEAMGRRALIIPTDVTQAEQVNSLMEKTVTSLGGLDILINNAGVGLEKPVLETEDEEWDRVMDTNLKGPFLCCRAAGKCFVEQRRGKVVNVASGLGEKGYPTPLAPTHDEAWRL